MSMLGRKPARAPLSGADIPDSSITTAKIVDGTVAEGDLAFSTATQAELDAQRTNSSITTLGTVTAGNLSNANIVYPDGHVIGLLGKAQDRTRRVYASRTDNIWYDDYTQLNLTVTPTHADNLLWFVGQVSYGIEGGIGGSVFLQFLKDGDATNTLNGDDSQSYGIYPCFHQKRWSTSSTNTYHMEQASINGYILAGTTNAQVFKIRYRIQAVSLDFTINRDGYPGSADAPGSHSPTGQSNLQIYEVKQ
jgi:hypothetical protein